MRIPTRLVGCEVHRLAFDAQVRIMFSAYDEGAIRTVDAELVIETAFRLRDAIGVQHDLDPGMGAQLAPLLDLFGRAVTMVQVGGRGTLALAFDDGAELVVEPDPLFESWHLGGSGVAPVLVGPGGETGWSR